MHAGICHKFLAKQFWVVAARLRQCDGLVQGNEPGGHTWKSLVGESQDGDLGGDMEPRECHDRIANQLSAKLRGAMALLMEGTEYADRSGGSLWDFAVEIQQFRKLELTPNDLRFLVRLDLIAHASETTGPRGTSRQFRRTGQMFFTQRTCFVLTPQGLAVSAALRNKRASGSLDPAEKSSEVAARRQPRHVPVWDAARRVLSLDEHLIKHFRHHATNQETILSTFQEEGWPERIDDPLVPSPSILSKRRLHDAIKSLNRKQVNPLIHFHGDGTGEGIAWEELDSSGKRTG